MIWFVFPSSYFGSKCTVKRIVWMLMICTVFFNDEHATVVALSNGAVNCEAGATAFGSVHIVPPFTSGALSDFNLEVSIDDETISSGTTKSLVAGNTYTIRVSGDAYKGVFFRLAPDSGDGDLTAMVTSSDSNLKTLSLCIAPVVGYTHKDSSSKTSSEITFTPEDIEGDITLNVAVVVSYYAANIWGYSSYKVSVSAAAAPTPVAPAPVAPAPVTPTVPTPTAPISAPVDSATTSAPTGLKLVSCNVCGPTDATITNEGALFDLSTVLDTFESEDVSCETIFEGGLEKVFIQSECDQLASSEDFTTTCGCTTAASPVAPTAPAPVATPTTTTPEPSITLGLPPSNGNGSSKGKGSGKGMGKSSKGGGKGMSSKSSKGKGMGGKGMSSKSSKNGKGNASADDDGTDDTMDIAPSTSSSQVDQITIQYDGMIFTSSSELLKYLRSSSRTDDTSQAVPPSPTPVSLTSPTASVLDEKDGTTSSSDLLSRLRSRNKDTSSVQGTEESPSYEYDGIDFKSLSEYLSYMRVRNKNPQSMPLPTPTPVSEDIDNIDASSTSNANSPAGTLIQSLRIVDTEPKSSLESSLAAAVTTTTVETTAVEQVDDISGNKLTLREFLIAHKEDRTRRYHDPLQASTNSDP